LSVDEPFSEIVVCVIACCTIICVFGFGERESAAALKMKNSSMLQNECVYLSDFICPV